MEDTRLALVIDLALVSGAVTIEDILYYRLPKECLSIFNVDGTVLHTATHTFLDHLLNHHPTADKPSQYYSLHLSRGRSKNGTDLCTN